MKSEELFEIDRRINQIKRNLQTREQKASEWSVPYQKILHGNTSQQTLSQQLNHLNMFQRQEHLKTQKGEECLNSPLAPATKKSTAKKSPCQIDSYMSSYSDSQGELDDTMNIERKNIQVRKKAMQKRIKVHSYHNELKQLQELQIKRTKIHLLAKEAQIEKRRQEKQKQTLTQFKESVLQKSKTSVNFFSKKNRVNGFENTFQNDGCIRNNTVNTRFNSSTGDNRLTLSIQKGHEINEQERYEKSKTKIRPDGIRQTNHSGTVVVNPCSTLTSSPSLLTLQSNCSHATSKRIRNIKDRVNPFNNFKVEKLIELYQEGKQSGRDSLVNKALGIGIHNTPYASFSNKMQLLEALNSRKSNANINSRHLSRSNSKEKSNSPSKAHIDCSVRPEVPIKNEGSDVNMKGEGSPDAANTEIKANEASNASFFGRQLQLNLENQVGTSIRRSSSIKPSKVFADGIVDDSEVKQKMESIAKCKRNLPQGLNHKINQKENIYLDTSAHVYTGSELKGSLKGLESIEFDRQVHRNTGSFNKESAGSSSLNRKAPTQQSSISMKSSQRGHKKNIFEDRMKKILKYHGNFWNDFASGEKANKENPIRNSVGIV